MTAATLDKVAMSDTKQAMGASLVASDKARTIGDRIAAAPAAAKEGLVSVARALKLDDLFSWAKDKLAWLFSGIGRVIGWKNIAVVAACLPATWKAIDKTVTWIADHIESGTARSSGWLAKIPFVGKHLAKANTFVGSMIVKGLRNAQKLVHTGLDKVRNSKFGELLSDAAMVVATVVGSIFSRRIGRQAGAAIEAKMGRRARIGTGLVLIVLSAVQAVFAIRDMWTEIRARRAASKALVVEAEKIATEAVAKVGAGIGSIVEIPAEALETPAPFSMKLHDTRTGKIREVTVKTNAAGEQWFDVDGFKYDVTVLPPHLLKVDEVVVGDLSAATVSELADAANAKLNAVQGGSRAARREQAKAHGPAAKKR